MTDSAPIENETITTTAASESDTLSNDPLAEMEKWKNLARKHEDRAKANAKAAAELEELKKSMLTDQEKAIDEARREARQQTVAEYSTKLVDAKLEASLNGRILDANAVLSFEKSQFITKDGDIDEDAISNWVESNTKTPEAVYPDLAQGQRGNAPALNSDPLLADLKSKLGIS
jgi:multidrug efflux pump subunit AcrA (membrane-fusion protein)